MENKKVYIEDRLFYRFFNAAYRYLKLNIYYTVFNVFLFLLCNFMVLRGDTIFVYAISALVIGPALMSMLENIQQYKLEGTLPDFRNHSKNFFRFFRKGIVISLLLVGNLFWFFIMLEFLQSNRFGLLLLPFFFTLGSITLATLIHTMVILSQQWKAALLVTLREAFFLSMQNLLISYYCSVLLLVLVFVMYYRPILGFLILPSLIFAYLHHLSSHIIVKKSDGGE